MIILGIVLIIAGLLLPELAVLVTIGVILLAPGRSGRPVGGRSHWY